MLIIFRVKNWKRWKRPALSFYRWQVIAKVHCSTVLRFITKADIGLPVMINILLKRTLPAIVLMIIKCMVVRLLPKPVVPCVWYSLMMAKKLSPLKPAVRIWRGNWVTIVRFWLLSVPVIWRTLNPARHRGTKRNTRSAKSFFRKLSLPSGIMRSRIARRYKTRLFFRKAWPKSARVRSKVAGRYRSLRLAAMWPP